MSKSWQEFLEKHNISADRQAASEQRAHKFIASLKLGELRKARELTQQQLAETLGISQASVSELESRADLLLSTLGRFIQASGGELQLVAHYPDGDILIDRLAKPEQAPQKAKARTTSRKAKPRTRRKVQTGESTAA